MKTSRVHEALHIFLFLSTTYYSVEGGRIFDNFFSHAKAESDATGKMWAVLVAGSNTYSNYRHQADVCHAYQVLKKGGLKDENIIVFMYDDIATDPENPTPGKIVNKPKGPDVYNGVVKDYTGKDVNSNNLYAVLLGNKTALTGGSGKVLSSGPDDHVFFYYTDHGGPGMLAMPEDTDYVYAKDLVNVLKKKYEMKGYKKMAMYIEACESGSMVDGLLPEDIELYTTTASKPDENSWACYCPDMFTKVDSNASHSLVLAPAPIPGPTPPAPAPVPGPEPGTPNFYGACLGDCYSVAWLEDSDEQDPQKETLRQQYLTVKKLTNTSQVMEYGDMCPRKMKRSLFMGSNSAQINHYITGADTDGKVKSAGSSTEGVAVSQPDTKLGYLWNKYQRAPKGSSEQMDALQKYTNELHQREQEDRKIQGIVKILFKDEDVWTDSSVEDGKPLVDDWECFKTMVRTYEKQCGRLSEYGRKYTRVMARMCNKGITKEKLIDALHQVSLSPIAGSR